MLYQTPYNSFEDPYKTFRQEYPIPTTSDVVIHGERITDMLHIEGYDDEPWFGSGGQTESGGTKTGFGWDDVANVIGIGAGVWGSIKKDSNVTYDQLTGGAINQPGPATSQSKVSKTALIAGISGIVLLVVILIMIKKRK